MRVIRKTTIYKCDWCGKNYQIERHAQRHESGCKKNPENHRDCFGCAFLTKKEVKFTVDYYGGEKERELHVCFCDKKRVVVTPPNAYEIEPPVYIGENEVLQQEMPKDCEDRISLFEV